MIAGFYFGDFSENKIRQRSIDEQRAKLVEDQTNHKEKADAYALHAYQTKMAELSELKLDLELKETKSKTLENRMEKIKENSNQRALELRAWAKRLKEKDAELEEDYLLRLSKLERKRDHMDGAFNRFRKKASK